CAQPHRAHAGADCRLEHAHALFAAGLDPRPKKAQRTCEHVLRGPRTYPRRPAGDSPDDPLWGDLSEGPREGIRGGDTVNRIIRLSEVAKVQAADPELAEDAPQSEPVAESAGPDLAAE